MTEAQGAQKRASGPLVLELETVGRGHVCWETNSGPLEERLVFLATESPLQPQRSGFTSSIPIFTVRCCAHWSLQALRHKTSVDHFGFDLGQ